MKSYRKTKAGNFVVFYSRKGYRKARYQRAKTRAWIRFIRKFGEFEIPGFQFTIDGLQKKKMTNFHRMEI